MYNIGRQRFSAPASSFTLDDQLNRLALLIILISAFTTVITKLSEGQREEEEEVIVKLAPANTVIAMSYQDSSERFNITSNRHHDVYPAVHGVTYN